MVKNRDRENKTRGKTSIDDFAGVILTILDPLFKPIIHYLEEEKGWRITEESKFFLLVTILLFVDKYLPQYSELTLFSALILFVINIAGPNLSLIRENFFKTDLEKLRHLLKEKSDQDVLNVLNGYLTDGGKRHITTKELDYIFKRFPDNYKAYDMVMRYSKLNEAAIKWFIDKNFIKQNFVDESLIVGFINSCRIDISWSSFVRINEELIEKKVNPWVFREFNYKFIRCTKMNGLLKDLVYKKEVIANSLLALVGIFTLLALASAVLFSLVLTQKTELTKSLISIQSSIFACALIAYICIWILNIMTRLIIKLFVPSTPEKI